MAEIDESAELAALRRGDEAAFLAVVGRLHGSMVRVAMHYVSSAGIAEEVVQETWIAVLRGLAAFEGRSSLRTWVFRILVNFARKRGKSEARCAPFSSFAKDGAEDEPPVDADRFLADDHPRWPGHWAKGPEPWGADRLQSIETIEHVRRAIEALPANQQDVINLRDVEGWSSEEICEALGISEANQRVLLHRARSKVRASLEVYLRSDDLPAVAAPMREAVAV